MKGCVKGQCNCYISNIETNKISLDKGPLRVIWGLILKKLQYGLKQTALLMGINNFVLLCVF